MIHDTANCPEGAVDYHQGIKYPYCLCFNKKAKYCKQHNHEKRLCDCPIEERWVERNFGGDRCPAERCPYQGEYHHCSHRYCRKYKRYVLGYL